MNHKVFVFSPFQENTYVLFDETKECVIIDPGNFFPNESEQLDLFLEENDLKLTQIITTHNHLDHIFGVEYLVSKYGARYGCHQDEVVYIDTFLDTCSNYGIPRDKDVPKPDYFFNDGDKIEFGNSELIVILVPGHSMGGVAFYSKKEGELFCGDILFRRSVGRTDLPGGNHRQLISGIKEKLLVLPNNTKVFSGHGVSTTVGEEKEMNQFLS